MNGRSFQKTLSKSFQTNTIATVMEIILLLGLGVFAAVLRARLRLDLNISGRHGLEIMALVMAGRMFTRISFGATISMIGLSTMMFIPVLGYKDPFLPIIFVGIGITVDMLIFFLGERWQHFLIFWVIVGGLAYMVIPLSRIIIHFTTGMYFDSFARKGFLIPTISHFVAGAAGALLGSGFIYSMRKMKKEKK